MPFITSDQIRDISVKTVEDFLNNKIPLSTGLSKHASDMQLNSEQIQRAVEATNSIAYLKVLSMSDDRTVEFPLCKFAEVMIKVAIPEPTSILPESNIEKIASTPVSASPYLVNTEEMSLKEKQTYFIKIASLTERELQQLEDRSIVILPELMKLAGTVKKDPEGLEKLATIVSDIKEFNKITSLVYGKSCPYSDTGIFKEAELKEVYALKSLLKEATELTSSIKEKTNVLEKTAHLKQAFLGALGSGIGKAIGGVISAPIKALTMATTKSVKNVSNSATDLGRKTIGKPTLNIPKQKYGIGAGIMGAGTVVSDATLYNPSRDATTGRSKDIWTSLQRE